MKTSKQRAKHIWEIIVIVLLNLAIITAVVLPYSTAKNVTSSLTLSRLGSRGDEVKKIQQALKNNGYFNSAVDGIYGVKTQAAVIKFQKATGLAADGIAGKKTLLYLGITSGDTSSGTNNSQYSNSDVALLARVISGESRGEPYEGQVAVGAVVLNRVSHSSFPDSISGVVYQKGAFSCITDSNWKEPTSESAKRAAIDAINGWDPTGGAVYYYNPAKTTNKFMHSLKTTKVIGKHRFAMYQ